MTNPHNGDVEVAESPITRSHHQKPSLPPMTHTLHSDGTWLKGTAIEVLWGFVLNVD